MSNWITAKVAEYQAKQALIEFSKEAERATQESRVRNAAQSAAMQEALRQQRAADLTGKKLAQTCQEWRKADSDLKSNNPNELSSLPHVPIRNRLVSVLGWRMAAR